MIAYLVGKPRITPKSLVILTSSGVGYGVSVGSQMLANLSAHQGESEVALYIHTHVREDVLELFGFKDEADKELFELLLSVSGVGPRTALALSDLGSTQLITAVQQADTTLLSSVPRVGKKLAQKIIIELKSKLGSWRDLYLGPQSPLEQDVVEALVGLGFNETDVHRVVSDMDFTEFSEASQAIKAAMQQLGQPR